MTHEEQSEELAQRLYSAWAAWNVQRHRVAVPLWPYVREDIKERFLYFASDLIRDLRGPNA